MPSLTSRLVRVVGGGVTLELAEEEQVLADGLDGLDQVVFQVQLSTTQSSHSLQSISQRVDDGDHEREVT